MRKSCLIQITSRMGSIADNTSGRSYAYRLSKTALNMATKNLSHDLGGRGFVTFCIHPGWVQTDMGSAHAPLSVEEATRDVLDNALTTDRTRSGSFLGPGGTILPW